MRLCTLPSSVLYGADSSDLSLQNIQQIRSVKHSWTTAYPTSRILRQDHSVTDRQIQPGFAHSSVLTIRRAVRDETFDRGSRMLEKSHSWPPAIDTSLGRMTCVLPGLCIGSVLRERELVFVFAGIPLRRIPWSMVLCIVALMALGLSGISRADELNDGPNLFSKQVNWMLFAIPALVASLSVPYRTWKSMGYLLFALSMPLLLVVFLMPRRNGAQCWIQLGYFDVQPSEIVKLTFILALAQYLMYRENHRRASGLIAPFAITAVPLILILREPDLGSAMLFIPVLFAMLFAAGARPRHLAFVALLGVFLSPLFWLKMNPEQKSRVVALFSQADGQANPGGDRWHQHQSKLVMSLGGAYGSETSGPILEDPDAYRLFAAQTDFVFCMIGERWGLVGGIVTLAIYLALFAKGFMIAAHTREPFGRLVAVGIVALLATQTVINTAMTVGLLPVVGITLPLMSYGGSSLLITAVALGLLMNVGMRPGYEMTPEPFRFE